MGRRVDPSNDPGLPVLAKILALGLAAVLPCLDLDDDRVRSIDNRRNEVRVCAHKVGRHATLEARVAERRVAVLLYSEYKEREAEVYKALAAEGLTSGVGVRVPALVACDPALGLLAVEWLEGTVASDLIDLGKGERAGVLAARWMERAASFTATVGKPFGTEHALYRVDKCALRLADADPDLGSSAAELSRVLKRAIPAELAPRLVHGAFHVRNILDLGDGPGVIDWNQFGQGPAEIEAGMFLASLSQLALDAGRRTSADRASAAFVERTAHLVETRALAWHRSAALVFRASRALTHRNGDWRTRVQALLNEAAGWARVA